MSDRDTRAVKLITLNMHKGFSVLNRRFILHDLREAIRNEDADLVLLQEVLGEHTEHSTRWEHWPDHAQYEFLADTTWQEFAYGKNAVYPAGHHGNAVLSKFPITHHANHDVSTYDQEKRGLLHCVLDVPDWPHGLHAICVHLGLFERHRRMQLDMLCQLLADAVPADAPLAIAGDFNDWRQWAHDYLADRAGLREVFIQHFGRAARSFPVRFPLLRLDRIYTRHVQTAAPTLHTGKPWTRLSDHAPLSVELTPA